MPNLSDAIALRQLGWQAVPAPLKAKIPVGSWKRWQTERMPERDVREAFERTPDLNLFIITGTISRLVVLDCDNEAAITYWTERIGADVLEATTQVKTGNGMHYYFRLPQGRVERGRSSTDADVKWDIRAEGQGVVAPPSVHPTGRLYQWVDGRGPDQVKQAPKELWRGEADGESGSGGEGPRSLLVHLLTHPPAGTESGRNNWLAQVAGHYASNIPYLDAFTQMVLDANEKLEVPLPVGGTDDEVEKLVASIWQAERAKQGRAVPPPEEGENPEEVWWKELTEPTEENGWLVSGRTRILCQTRERVDRDVTFGLKPWMNADIHALGITGQGEARSYEVELISPDWRIETSLPATTIADSRALSKWLAGYGVSVAQPDDIWPVRIKDGARLLRYLELQGAEAMEVAEALGWHEESLAFITHDGLIRATGPGPHEGIRPAPTLRNWAPHRYGFGGKPEAQRVLSEVLTYHDETVSAVFGSWWAATLLKPQIHKVSSQFPFIALEATSESGKTVGMLSLIMQLSGYKGGSTATTRAAFRDALSAHRSGIVWLDDLDSLEQHMELLRQVTVEGSLIKKGSDHQSQVVAPLRAALVVSGENLGLRDQKALLDRAILLDVPSPVGRRSLKGDWPQWDDILSLRELYPDLTDFAGSIVELALGQMKLVKDIKKLRNGAGRHADKGAVLRLGARILSGMLDGNDMGIVERIDNWVEHSVDLGQENALTLRALPSALGRWGWPTYPQIPNPDRRRGSTPAWIEQEPGKLDVVWFSPKLLAEWLKDMSSRVQGRLDSEEALVQQARALGLGGTRKRFRLKNEFGNTDPDDNTKYFYWRVEGDLAEDIIRRSRGDLD